MLHKKMKYRLPTDPAFWTDYQLIQSSVLDIRSSALTLHVVCLAALGMRLPCAHDWRRPPRDPTRTGKWNEALRSGQVSFMPYQVRSAPGRQSAETQRWGHLPWVSSGQVSQIRSAPGPGQVGLSSGFWRGQLFRRHVLLAYLFRETVP